MGPDAAVVTCFLRHRGDVLLLKPASTTAPDSGKWTAVAGYIEDSDPRTTARRAIEEQTGLTNTDLIRAGSTITVEDTARDQRWTVHPYLFETASRAVTLTDDASTADWTSPTQILRRDTVPELWRSYDQVRPTPGTIAADTDHGAAYLSYRALEVVRDAAAIANNENGGIEAVTAAADAVCEAHPSMTALRNRVNRVLATGDTPHTIETTAIEALNQAINADADTARRAAEKLPDTVLTLSRSGTVIDALTHAEPAVIIAESRPAREGIAVAEQLANAGLDITVCPDAAIAHVLTSREPEAVVVGADTILPDGTVINKTGTRGAALAAAHEELPCYVIAATDKISPEPDVAIESGDATTIYDGQSAITVINPRFDRTPPDRITGIITERGALSPDDIQPLAQQFREHAAWQEEKG